MSPSICYKVGGPRGAKERCPGSLIRASTRCRMREVSMRTIAFSVGTIVVTLLNGVGSSRADYYPWCAQYTLPGGASNCGFTTLAQCQAAVSGVGGYCIKN